MNSTFGDPALGGGRIRTYSPVLAHNYPSGPERATAQCDVASSAHPAIQIRISRGKSDPSQGIVNYGTPIARVLLDAEEGDEVEVLVGSYIKRR